MVERDAMAEAMGGLTHTHVVKTVKVEGESVEPQ